MGQIAPCGLACRRAFKTLAPLSVLALVDGPTALPDSGRGTNPHRGAGDTHRKSMVGVSVALLGGSSWSSAAAERAPSAAAADMSDFVADNPFFYSKAKLNSLP
jgi:hypothetical protein